MSPFKIFRKLLASWPPTFFRAFDPFRVKDLRTFDLDAKERRYCHTKKVETSVNKEWQTQSTKSKKCNYRGQFLNLILQQLLLWYIFRTKLHEKNAMTVIPPNQKFKTQFQIGTVCQKQWNFSKRVPTTTRKNFFSGLPKKR